MGDNKIQSFVKKQNSNVNSAFLLFLVYLLILFYVFGHLILNIDTHLISWLDTPYNLWLNNQVAQKLLNLDFRNFFETNAFWPNKLSLYYSDTHILQGLMTYVLGIFSSEIIKVFNLTFIINLVLNYIFTYLFWTTHFNSKLQSFGASIIFIFSPFFFNNVGHYQLMAYWPGMASLYFLRLSVSKQISKYVVISAIFATIQFLASVYLAFFMLVVVAIKLLLGIINRKHKAYYIRLVLAYFGVFLLSSGYFIAGYIRMKHINNFVRDPSEYITYSAHLSDYLFTTGVNSFASNSGIYEKWNSFNKHIWGERASFPGFSIMVPFLVALFIIKRDKQRYIVGVKMDKESVFFGILIVLGFLFSLGTRLSFNGNYSHIPLPYNLFVKYLPMFDAIRATARWSFILYLGLSWFAVKGLVVIYEKIKNNNFKIIAVALFSILWVWENLPLQLEARAEDYYNGYSVIERLCREEKKVLLELPLGHLDDPRGVIKGLNYITKSQMASVIHKCYLVNGYSGFEPQSLVEMRNVLGQIIETKDWNKFHNLIRSYQVSIVKVNNPIWKELLEYLEKQDILSEVDTNVYVVSKEEN